jgi:hypothetical protein
MRDKQGVDRSVPVGSHVLRRVSPTGVPVMVRHLVCATALVLVLAAGAWAGEYVGSYQSIDRDGRVTVRLEGKGAEHTYRMDEKVRLVDEKGREYQGIKTARNLFKEGQQISYTTEKREGQEWVVEIKAKK